jgi:hypothetical protein
MPCRLPFGDAGIQALATADPPMHALHRETVFPELVAKRMAALEPDCQRTSGSPHWRTLEFPADGHEFSPRTDTEFPTDRPGSFTRPAASPPSRWWRLEA